mmetsp:Transcript_48008/g.102832  ORF Transcript_48008/g.102832 Transcript_48008/m.102832 type:complete len:235 (+) Transcript_48008:1825-2529(+)
MEDDVLGGGAGRELSIDRDEHGLGLLLEQSLGGQNVFHLRCTNAEGNCSEGAVGGCVAVATDDGGAWQGKALLGANHVDDALSGVVHAEVGETEVLDVLLQGHALVSRVRLGDEAGDVFELFSAGGGDVVVHGGQGAIGAPHLSAGHGQAFEGLGGGDLVHEVSVDVHEASAIVHALDDVVLEDLLVERRHLAAWRLLVVFLCCVPVRKFGGPGAGEGKAQPVMMLSPVLNRKT